MTALMRQGVIIKFSASPAASWILLTLFKVRHHVHQLGLEIFRQRNEKINYTFQLRGKYVQNRNPITIVTRVN